MRDRNSRLRHWVENISGRRHGVTEPEELEQRACLIESTLTGFGFEVASQPVRHAGRTFRNLIVTIPGENPALAKVLLGAHYDGPFGSPGADDNASGVAVLLDVARQMVSHRPARTIECVAFTLEESQGDTFLIGSRHFVEVARRARQQYHVALILESVGYRSLQPGSQYLPRLVAIDGIERGDFLAIIGDHRSEMFARQFSTIASAAVPALKTLAYAAPPSIAPLIPELRLSDHAAFWDAGYPALMLTDTAPLRNPNYHQPSDTPETLDYGFLEQVAEAVTAVLRVWSGA